MAWTDSLYSSGLRSSDETGNSGRSCHEAPEPSFAQNSSKLFFQRAGSNPTSRARMWTMTALRQFGRTSLHHEAITSIT